MKNIVLSPDVAMLRHKAEKTVGGLEVYNKEQETAGEVALCGNDIDAEVGDRIIAEQWTGSKFVLEGVQYVFVRKKHILAVVKNNYAKAPKGGSLCTAGYSGTQYCNAGYQRA